MTTIGLIATLGLNLIKFAGEIAGYKLKIKTHRNGCSFITEVGSNWGGLELGAFALCGNYSETNPDWFDHTRKHEFGHAIQHLYLGIFFIFIVAIPSASRYWLLEIDGRKNKNIFAICVGAALILLAGGVVILAAYTTLWLFILVGLLVAYAISYMYWMTKIEIPKYDASAPKYDSIWFEGGATKTGAKFVDWLEN